MRRTPERCRQDFLGIMSASWRRCLSRASVAAFVGQSAAITPHGGVTSTSFNSRSAQSSASDPVLTDYDDFVKSTGAAFASMAAGSSMSSDDVDGRDQLRYLVGDDARGFVKARREMSENDYIAFMCSKFLPQS